MKFFTELYQYKDLLYNLTMKELKLKYKNSFLGIIWSLFNPLMMIVIYTIAFNMILRIEIENYSVYVFTALLPWFFFQTSVNQGAGSIISYSSLVSKVYFPRSVIPVSIVLANFINYLLTLIILFLALLFFNITFSVYLLWLPIILLIIFAFVLGFSLIITALNTKYRDIAYLMEVIFTAWFYLTPIIYPLSMVPEKVEPYILINPFTSMIECLRAILINGTAPEILNLSVSIISAIIFLLIGIYVFKSRESNFVNEL